MSGIDYQAVRAAISLKQVLDLLGYEPCRRDGPQLRGPCPLHDPRGPDDRRCFSVHLTRGIFRCFRCGAHGNQLDLWRLTSQLPLYQATIDLCHRAQLDPPRLPPPVKSQVNSRNSSPDSSRQATD